MKIQQKIHQKILSPILVKILSLNHSPIFSFPKKNHRNWWKFYRKFIRKLKWDHTSQKGKSMHRVSFICLETLCQPNNLPHKGQKEKRLSHSILCKSQRRKNRNVFPFVSKPALYPPVCQHSQETIKGAKASKMMMIMMNMMMIKRAEKRIRRIFS